MNRRRKTLLFLMLTASFLLFILLLFPSGNVYAKVNKVVAEIQPSGIEVGESLLYSVTVSGTGSLPTPTVNIPSAFQIVSGPNTNLSMDFVGGQMSSTKVLSYRLRAMRKGDFVIPAPEVKVRRKIISGNEVKVRVGASSSKQGSQRTQSTTRNPQQRRSNKSTQNSKAKAIFLKAEVDKDEVYFQQPIKITYTLYFQPSVQTFDLRKLPSTEGFWTEPWPISNPPEIFRETINGVRYNAAVIHRAVLFPAKTGDLVIGGMDVLVQYRTNRKSRSIFDSFFDENLDNTEVHSEPIKIEVKALPEKGKPADFQNIVGNYKLSAALDVNKVQANESVTLLVSISGEGNIGFLPEPIVKIPADIERYEPQVNQSSELTNGKVRGYKNFSYLLIPRRAGVQKISPVKLTVFNPDTKRYETLTTKELKLTVSTASGWTDTDNIPGGSPTAVQTVGTDIRWILDSSKNLKRSGSPYHERFEYWILYLIPVTILLSGWVIAIRLRKRAGQTEIIRSKKAARLAMKVLKQAYENKSSGKLEEGYDSLAMGMSKYISDKLALVSSSFDPGVVKKELAKRGSSESSCKEFEDIMNLCNSARFTPMGKDEKMLQGLLERAERWITSIDKMLDSKFSETVDK